MVCHSHSQGPAQKNSTKKKVDIMVATVSFVRVGDMSEIKQQNRVWVIGSAYNITCNCIEITHKMILTPFFCNGEIEQSWTYIGIFGVFRY